MGDRGRSGGAPWTHGGSDRGHGDALTGAWPPAALVRQSSPAGAQNGEGSAGNLARASPELGRRCGGRATVVQNGEAAALGEKELLTRKHAIESEVSVVMAGGCSLSFYRDQGRAPRGVARVTAG
jgi:hypothetical protein